MASNKLEVKFHQVLNAGKILVKYLKKEAHKWLMFGSKLPKDTGSEPGETRYKFTQHLVEVIKDEVYEATLNTKAGSRLSCEQKMALWKEIRKLGDCDNFIIDILQSLRQDLKSTFMSMWSPDHKTYIAAKPVPGVGALVYLAVAEKPECGWDIPEEKPELL